MSARRSGLHEATLDILAKGHHWWDGKSVDPERLAEAGLDADSLAVKQLMTLTQQLMGFPRHLSQHTGGFVLTRGPLSRIVPIENASMPDRTVIEWDKDDLDAMGLLKVDVLALGMLTAIRKSLDLIGQRKGHVFEMQDIPAEDPDTFDMICKADTVGVFQIESRAQMSMLPRLKPRCFYDLVIEVALVRPGPIQGGAVHPYLDRRQGKVPVSYPSAELEEGAGADPGRADLPGAVHADRHPGGGLHAGRGGRACGGRWRPGSARAGSASMSGADRRHDRAGLHAGIRRRASFEQVKGFSSYGFPESHAASFALLVYASCWIKHHHPAEFLTAMLNSQPLGFYTPEPAGAGCQAASTFKSDGSMCSTAMSIAAWKICRMRRRCGWDCAWWRA